MNKYLEANIIFSKFSRDYMDSKNVLPIRPSEMGVLNIIAQREGLFTPLMIAELLEVSKPMITAHINNLEKKGYIIRQFSNNDKRSFFVIPTSKAKELVKTTNEKMNKMLSSLEEKLGEENFKTLLNLIEDATKILRGDL